VQREGLKSFQDSPGSRAGRFYKIEYDIEDEEGTRQVRGNSGTNFSSCPPPCLTTSYHSLGLQLLAVKFRQAKC
jgi:hypothetical protein